MDTLPPDCSHIKAHLVSDLFQLDFQDGLYETK